MITKENFKTIHDVVYLVETGAYEVKVQTFKALPENFIIDENKSVKWNRYEVENLNSENKAKTIANINLQKKMKNEILEDLAIALSLEHNFTNAQSDTIVLKAWLEGHSTGIRGVVHIIEDLVNFISEFNK